jgi:hypothetical protein
LPDVTVTENCAIPPLHTTSLPVFAAHVKLECQPSYLQPPLPSRSPPMHALALLSLAAHGLLLPPTVTFKGEALVADGPREAVATAHRKPPARWWEKQQDFYPWKDGEAFKTPLPEYLLGNLLEFEVSPTREIIRVVLIECKNEERAKEYFLQLHLRRIPDYARSGRFLIKADKQSLKWFTTYYGADAYFIRHPRDWFWDWAISR